MILFRHGRACPGHPRLVAWLGQDVDARHKAGHDEAPAATSRERAFRTSARPELRCGNLSRRICEALHSFCFMFDASIQALSHRLIFKHSE
jgi:hypothetical protein